MKSQFESHYWLNNLSSWIYLPGLFDIPLHVKYTTYNVTTEDWRSPDLGWCSCTVGKTDIILVMTHKIKLNEMKNLFKAHVLAYNQKIHN